ncbi:B3 domain-containing protein Os12g0592300-like [Carex rostrata]
MNLLPRFQLVPLERTQLEKGFVVRGNKELVFAQESSGSESESDKGEHKTLKKRKTRENNRAKKDSCLYVVSRRTYMTKAQEQIANRMARKTQKGSYLFVKILAHTETYIHNYCRLNLPSGFACNVLQSGKKKITLLFADLDKRSDICTASYSKTKTTRFISGGWREFVSKNRLKQGNLCLFELRKKDKQGSLTMVVHLIG